MTQILAIILALINLDYNHVSFGLLRSLWDHPHKVLNCITYVAMTIAIVMTVISGVDYFVKNKEVFKSDK